MDASDPLLELAAHLQLESGILQEVLSRLQTSPDRAKVRGFYFYGSRTHQFWGEKYDLNLLPILYSGMNRPNLDGFEDFQGKYGFKVDIGAPLPYSDFLRRLIDYQAMHRLLQRATPFINPYYSADQVREIFEGAAFEEGIDRRFMTIFSVIILNKDHKGINTDLSQAKRNGYKQIYLLNADGKLEKY